MQPSSVVSRIKINSLIFHHCNSINRTPINPRRFSGLYHARTSIDTIGLRIQWVATSLNPTRLMPRIGSLKIFIVENLNSGATLNFHPKRGAGTLPTLNIIGRLDLKSTVACKLFHLRENEFEMEKIGVSMSEKSEPFLIIIERLGGAPPLCVSRECHHSRVHHGGP